MDSAGPLFDQLDPRTGREDDLNRGLYNMGNIGLIGIRRGGRDHPRPQGLEFSVLSCRTCEIGGIEGEGEIIGV